MDIERLKVDREYWDSVAPFWAKSIIGPDSEAEMYWFEHVVGEGKARPVNGGKMRTANTIQPHAWDIIPRPEPRQVESNNDLPKMAIMVNPHEAPLQYGEEHLGKEIEVIEWLPDESCYVVRFDWGLGVLHDSMVDFGLYGIRTKEKREREELSGVILATDYVGEALTDRLADAIIAAGWRKTNV